MATIQQLLEAADPLRAEAAPSVARLGEVRRKVVSASSGPRRQQRQVSQRSVVLLGCAAAVLAIAAVFPAWLPSGTPLEAAMRFEVRIADHAPSAAARDVVDTKTGRIIYLEQEVVITNGDIAETRVVARPGGFGVEVVFTDLGAEKMRAVTAGNVGRLLAVVVDGEVLTAPRITSPIDQIGIISGDFSQEEAERLARGVVPRGLR